MSSPHWHWISPLTRWSVLLTTVGGAALAGCTAAATPEKEGGQTGSPALPPNGPLVPPDQSSPVPFRPWVPPPPPGGGELPTVPTPRPSVSERIARLGNTVYVADRARGLVVVDVSEPSLPQLVNGIRLPGGGNWLHVMGNKLLVAGPSSAQLEDFEGTTPIGTRIALLDVSEPQSPTLLDEVVIDGRALSFRPSEQHLVVLSAGYAASGCTPGGWVDGVLPSVVTVSSLAVEGDALTVSAQQSVPGESYLPADNGFLVTHGIVAGASDADSVTAIDVSNPGELRRWPAISVDGHLRSTPVRLAGDRLFFASTTAAGPVFNRAVLSETLEPSVEVLPVSLQAGPYDGLLGAIDEAFAVLVPPEEGAGVVIDLRGDQLAQVADVPESWRYVDKVGAHWFACDPSSAFSFELNDAGEIEPSAAIETPLMIATGRYFPPSHWDSAAQRLFVPYRTQSNGVVVESNVGALDFSGAELAWLDGTALQGDAQVYTDDGYSFALLYEQEQGLALTEAPVSPVEHSPALLNPFALAVDSELPAPDALELGALPSALALTDTHEVRLQRGPDRIATLDVRDVETSASVATLRLRYAAEQLVRVEDRVFAYSTHYTNECTPNPPEGFGPCQDTFRPALAEVSLAPEPRVVREVLLPTLTVPARQDISLYSWEWLELVQQAGQIGLLQHRGYQCSTVAACEELNTPYKTISGLCDDESGECDEHLRGNTDEQWFYPFDRAAGEFAEPFQVGAARGYDYVTAQGISSSDSVNFLAFTTLQQNPDGFHADVARFELVHAPSSESQARITLPGFPLRVAGAHVVSVTPAGALTGEAAVGVKVQVSELFEGNAYVVDTLQLPAGLQDSRWASDHGYLLLTPDDRCVDPHTDVIALELDAGEVREVGRLTLAGAAWQIAAASDERLVLERNHRQWQYAEIVVTEDELTLGEMTTLPLAVPVVVSENDVRLGAEADRSQLP